MRSAQMDDERPKNLTVTVMENNQPPAVSDADAATNVIWFEEPMIDLADSSLAAAKRAAEAGATVVFSGSTMPLLALYAGHPRNKSSKKRPDVVFEDFEHGYDKWKVEGDAFGTKPAEGTLPGQQTVTGFAARAWSTRSSAATTPPASSPASRSRSNATTFVFSSAAGRIQHADPVDRRRPRGAGVGRTRRRTIDARAVGRSGVRRQEGPHRDRR